MPKADDSKISIEEFERIVAENLPFSVAMGGRLESIAAGRATYRLPYKPAIQRPGGTIIGPALMALADITMYAVVMSLTGPLTMALTTNLTMNFLRRTGERDAIAEGRMLKHGKRLAYGDVTIFSAGDPEPVAHATLTYSIPPLGGGN